MFFDDALEVAAVRRCVLNGYAEMLAQKIRRTAFHFAPVCKDHGREMHTGPFFRRDLNAIPGTVFHLVFHRIEDRPGGVFPGRRIEGDVHSRDDVGETVHLEIHGRPADDGAPVIPADKVDICCCGIDLAGNAGPPQMGFRTPGLTPVFQVVAALAVPAEHLFQGVSVFPVPVEELLAGRDFVRIHRSNGIPILILYGVVIPDKTEIGFLKGKLLFAEIVFRKSSAEVPQILCGQFFTGGTWQLRPARPPGGILVWVP